MNTAPAPKQRQQTILQALRDFDSLPDSAHVRVQVVAALYASSVPTVWRRAKAGTMPAPHSLGPRVTAWNVGELRRDLEQHRGK